MMRVVVAVFLLACLSVQMPAHAQGAVKTQVADIKTQTEAQAYLAWKRDADKSRSSSADTATSARQYMQGLYGLGEGSYLLSARPGEGRSHVYRVTISDGVKGFSARERVFDVIIDASSGTVMGERSVP